MPAGRRFHTSEDHDNTLALKHHLLLKALLISCLSLKALSISYLLLEALSLQLLLSTSLLHSAAFCYSMIFTKLAGLFTSWIDIENMCVAGRSMLQTDTVHVICMANAMVSVRVRKWDYL